jgi:cyclase
MACGCSGRSPSCRVLEEHLILTTRVIPCLLLRGGALVKTIKFKDPSYVGDPTNAIRIFNEKEVDELIVLDISATIENRQPSFAVIEMFAGECFMPVAYGGGLNDLETVRQVLRLGIEKVVVNSCAVKRPYFIRELSDCIGSQAVVVSIDAKRTNGRGHEVYIHGGRTATGIDPRELAVQMQSSGAGEVFLNSIDQDGTMDGYDLELIESVTSAVDIPVIACGGAGNIKDLGRAVLEAGASAAAAGSMVVYFGRNRAVLINFPTKRDIARTFN